MHLLIFCSILLHLLNLSNAHLSGEVNWTHELHLETDFSIKWDAEDPDFLTMEISAPTSGYLGVGFSPEGDMINSDILIAWVDSKGIPHLKDYHGIGKNSPVEDDQQDYFLIAASERDKRTTVRFHRRWETCDEQHDIKIGNDTMRLIWAWHPDDPDSFNFPWHGISTRGTKNVFMRLPPKPLPFPDGKDGMDELPSEMKYWDLTLENVDIDGSKNAVYMCKIFKFQNPDQRNYQMIGFRPVLTEENEENIHRISIYQCNFPGELDDTEQSQFKDVNVKKTTECSTHDDLTVWTKHCKTTFLTWALGSEGEMFPSHVGVSLEDQVGDPATYFKLEVHYDNLSGKQFLDSSGMRVFYTDQPRIYDGGFLKIGHKTSPFLAIPPSQESFRIYSLCSRDCTRRGIVDSAGLNLLSVMLHGHTMMKKIRLRHIRKGKELSPIAEDNNYTHSYQQFRMMKNEVNILPGDELLLECEYNTLGRDQFTFGGYTTFDEEMCQAQLFYYPRANLISCESKPEFQSFFSGFGIRTVMGEGLRRISNSPPRERSDLLPPQFQLELEDYRNPFDTVFITEPSTLLNISVGERMRITDWKQKHVAKNLENSWRNGRHFLYCDGRKELFYEKYVDSIPKFQRQKKTLNSICRQERIPRNCSGQMYCANLLVILISVIGFAI